MTADPNDMRIEASASIPRLRSRNRALSAGIAVASRQLMAEREIMAAALHIVGICGSLRRGSLNRAVLRAAAALLPDDAAMEMPDLAGIPLYNEDVREQGTPSAVTDLANCVAQADALLIATPEYNYSVSGVLKNALDWLSKVEPQPLRGKPVALIGASPELAGTSLAQHHLRQILVCVNARVLPEPEVMIGGADTKFDENGILLDEHARAVIAHLMAALVHWARIVPR
jgi:chromate reductase, NAD(P)H dehydrogenase (quinone)